MAPRAAVFLDRDGTLIDDPGYLGDPDRVVLLPGAAEALRLLAGAGYALVVVSNQAGVARGLITEEQVLAVNERVAALLERGGARLDAVYYCPHHPDFTGPCDCRKPGIALLERAAADLGLDLASSWFVGDKVADIEAAVRAGTRPVLVATGHGAASARDPALPAGVPFVAGVAPAARLILEAARPPAPPT